ncbi:bifunctional DNA primase/polymerase [Corynebacterium sp. ES2775-CONJ]|uniref:bifunctional DNA primase/polymerase n=1 Tax=Corynebacterium sp. ES2775-CONJ TaxID=2974029 RepID=UPI002168BE85|nr:bifunctional DNA primase/polymerase [Corynebacterium sp. ES2775-CONJ]MCS4489426.1 bifunctional DNA primase/polymerase [Corynebacterium sp. ES2775-CONJ]
MSNKKTPTVGTYAGAIKSYPNTTMFGQVERSQWPKVGALRWARAGLEVGPLDGKRPLTQAVPNGFKSFTSDPKKVANWWAAHPTANIGARPPADVIVIDIDVKNGGIQYWKDLCAGRHVPETLAISTGSGGWHLWFTLPYLRDLRGQLGATTSGIDLKTHAGYLVMPPSIHPTTGGMYHIHHWHPLAALPELPTWLRPHVFKPLKPTHTSPARRGVYKGDKSHKGLVGVVAKAVEGNRNKALYWAARKALEDGHSIEDELINAAMGVGLSELEARRTVTSAQRAVAKEVA